MTVSNLNLTLRERNDETIYVTVTQNPGGAPYNLTGHNVEFWLKTSADFPDEADDSYSMSTVTGEITIVSPMQGQVQIEVPASKVPAPGRRFCRIDILSADNKRKTAAYGQVTIVDL